MNLATARSERRAREVGIRKSVGSRRHELIFQFIGESMIIAFISFAIAILLAQILLPSYNTLVDKKLFIDYTECFEFWLYSLRSYRDHGCCCRKLSRVLFIRIPARKSLERKTDRGQERESSKKDPRCTSVWLLYFPDHFNVCDLQPDPACERA